MTDSKKVIAMIPARAGSQRLPLKNLALINEKPLISYAIDAAKNSNAFDAVVVNSDHSVFAEIADRYKVKFYQRPKEFGSSAASTDEFVYDFIQNFESEYVAIVNPPSPLQTAGEVREIVNYFIENQPDSLVTVNEQYKHSLLDSDPINFDPEEKLAKTQSLDPIVSLVYSVMMWNTEIFKQNFESEGHAVLSGKIDYYPVNKLSGILVKHKRDLILIDSIMRGRSSRVEAVEYDPLASEYDLI
jgi:CMP-N-acetylneuraminic acid synthetase